MLQFFQKKSKTNSFGFLSAKTFGSTNHMIEIKYLKLFKKAS